MQNSGNGWWKTADFSHSAGTVHGVPPMSALLLCAACAPPPPSPAVAPQGCIGWGVGRGRAHGHAIRVLKICGGVQGPGAAVVCWWHLYLWSRPPVRAAPFAQQNNELMVCSSGGTKGMLNLAA